MKKNLRLVSASAAALLAVAPVVASSVSSVFADAADATLNTGLVKPAAATPASDRDGSSPAKAYVINLDVQNKTVDESEKVSSYKGEAFVVTPSVGQVVSYSKSNVTTGFNSGSEPASFVAGQTYYQNETVSFSGLEAGKYYTVNPNEAGKQASDSGVLADAVVSRKLSAVDSEAKGTPYFTDVEGNVLGNGEVANTTKPVEYTTANAAFVLNDAKKLVNFNDSAAKKGVNSHITTTVEDVKKQLEDQGVKLTNDKGDFKRPAKGFTLTLTGKNPENGKTATVKVVFAGETEKNTDYPVIAYKYAGQDTRAAEGSEVNAPAKNLLFSVDAGSKFDSVKTFGFHAFENNGNWDALDIKTVSNPVNTNVPGLYNVTLQATNTEGLTTRFTYAVRVLPTNGSERVVNYVPGYGVNLWSELNGQVSFNGVRVLHGNKVTLTGASKVVNGVTYYEVKSAEGVNVPANSWIQAQFVDGSYTQTAAKPASSTSSSDETKVSGVLTVSYNGKGKVRLVNSKGAYQNQYVAKNTKWKVFAKKTINGKTYYRIGTQNQWIPAQYSVVK